MAANKKSFIMYTDFGELFNELSDEDAGQLIKHIFDYVNDKDPETENPIVKISFIPIKNQLKRDLQDWEATREERVKSGRLGGLKSGESRKSKQTKQVLQNRSKLKQNEANEAVTVTGTVTVIEREEETLPRLEYKIEDCLMIALRDSRWVKAANATEKELHEFNRLLESRGQYKKNPSDYKSHFSNWKMTGKKSIEPERREPQTTYKTL